MDEKYSLAKRILEKYNQLHVLEGYNLLSETSKEKLLNQILRLDFETVKSIYDNKDSIGVIDRNIIQPIDVIDKEELDEEMKNECIKIGENIIYNNQYAVVIMAGGQGTRLGHNGPKGTYMLDVTPDKSIFEILIDRFKEAKEKYGVVVSCYIMTSRDNYDATLEFFEQHEYFDYPSNAIKFFNQEELPMLDSDGKIILEELDLIKEGANGNGGVFGSLYRNGILDEMNNAGISWIFISGVDNILANIIDPLFLGLTINANCPIASKSIKKRAPEEKAGVFCIKNGKKVIVNYNEISDEMSRKKDEKGNLLYGDINIVSHLFSIDSLYQIINEKLPYHADYKKSNYINSLGTKVIATEPNAFKFETYIFDSFEFFEDMMIYRVKREDEFAPIKNAQGEDSPQTAKELYLKRRCF